MYPSAWPQDIFVEGGKGSLTHPLKIDWPPNENDNYGKRYFFTGYQPKVKNIKVVLVHSVVLQGDRNLLHPMRSHCTSQHL